MKNLFKKTLNICVIFVLLAFTYIPAFSVKAAEPPYSVQMVSNTSANTVVGSYNTYNEAVTAMNKQNSTSTSVAAVYKDGKIINAKYAIFQFTKNTGTINLYQTVGGSAYTYVRPSSMTDAALLNSNEKQVQIMHEGFKGWVDVNAGSIIPISLLNTNTVNVTAEGLNLRADASTSSASLASITCKNAIFAYTEKKVAGGYTWYKINYSGKVGWIASGTWLTESNGTGLNTYYYRYSTGNLLHRYAYHNGTSYTDNFTNLGPTPTYLTEGVHYYSFDGGIYLYTSLVTMLNDYLNDTYTNSINANNPNYPYYLFLSSKSVSKATAADLDKQITNKNSKLYGTGKYFKEAEASYGMNALSAFAKARGESADGTSKIAMDKNNVFGYGAADSCPYECARSYASVYDSIIDYAKNGLTSYTTAEAVYYFGSHAGTKGSGRNVKYASDPLAGEKEAGSAFIADLNQNSLRDYKANTLGVSKYGKYSIPVYKDANTNTKLYTMQNQNSTLKVYNVPITVVDKVGNFYKIYAEKSGYQYGYVNVSDFNVSNNQPVIDASNQNISLNSSFNPLTGVSASDVEDGNLTSKIVVSGTVDVTKVGNYNVTYTVTDSSNFSASKTVVISVVSSGEPVITATDKEISQYTEFKYMDGVTANDPVDGNITSKITYSGTVDTNTVGIYQITYSVTNSNNKTTTKVINVKVIENAKPVINVVDKVAYLNGEFDPLIGVTATDKEDGDITSKIVVTENTVNTSVIGDYKVTYSVSDSANQTVTKTITVSVIEKVLKKAEAQFYMDYLKTVNNKLQLKGYNTIQGINNTLPANIKYKLIYTDIETGTTYTQNASRITNTSEMTRPIYSTDGKDYTYSWFVVDLDFNILNQGNYTLSIVSEGDEYYSKSVVSNKLDKPQNSSFSGEKNIIIRNNYSYTNSPVELIVRNDVLANKTAGTYYNQYDQYREFSFNNDGTLHLKGTSYSYGSNLAPNATVSRKIVFENVETFNKYTKDLGSITNGPYIPVLPVDDKLSKVKAWYDTNIDVSDIPKGKYYIYVTTTSNITDIYEFTEKMNRSLDGVKKTIDGKNYSFNINFNKGNRIEMIVQ